MKTAMVVALALGLGISAPLAHPDEICEIDCELQAPAPGPAGGGAPVEYGANPAIPSSQGLSPVFQIESLYAFTYFPSLGDWPTLPTSTFQNTSSVGLLQYAF